MDESQKDTDAGMLAWLLEHPEEMAVLIGI
jgi:hypothetical protein